MKGLRFLCFILLLACFDAGAIERFVYIGADALYRQSEFKKGYGKDLFNTRTQNCHVFMGIRANEHLSFEIGEIISPDHMKVVKINNPGPVLGVNGRNLPEHHLILSSMTGFTTGALWHLKAPWFERRVEGLLYTGLSILKCKYMDSVVSDNSGPFDLEGNAKTFTYRTGVPRVAFGISVIEGNIGIRLMTGVDYTSLFKVVLPEQVSNKKIHMKDSYFGGIGFFVKYP